MSLVEEECKVGKLLCTCHVCVWLIKSFNILNVYNMQEQPQCYNDGLQFSSSCFEHCGVTCVHSCVCRLLFGIGFQFPTLFGLLQINKRQYLFALGFVVTFVNAYV
jgi:hypothetical protein